MIRHSKTTSESWNSIDWKKNQKIVFRLQRRIFKAVREGQLVKARSLQKLVLKSTAAKLLAIRQVTQLNKGKRTAGIDGKKALKTHEKIQLLKALNKSAINWEHSGLREIPILKKNGKTRMLKVPTIADRAWQALAKLAIEPAHEATFHISSYGFRPGRSAKDAQQAIRTNLRSDHNSTVKRVIDRISHTSIMNEIIAPKGLKTGIFRCLKAGTDVSYPEQGTPQGGIISPVLANIALNGIENIATNLRPRYSDRRAKTTIRYADDLVIILKPEENADEIISKIGEFLAERGMNINLSKTKITPVTDGFNYLGWNFRVKPNGKLVCAPSKENYEAFKAKVKNIANSSHIGAEEKAKKIAPIVRGWRNYHDKCNMGSTRDSLWFLNHSTFKKFMSDKNMTKSKALKLIEKAFPSVPWSEGKFVKVKEDKSPFDGDTTYWTQRESKLYFGETSKALKRQNHQCDFCSLKFLPGDNVELHHKDGNHDNWKKNNLAAVHRQCHQEIHRIGSLKGENTQEPDAMKVARPVRKERCEG
jgi:RNA-directed DNA polymerase